MSLPEATRLSRCPPLPSISAALRSCFVSLGSLPRPAQGDSDPVRFCIALRGAEANPAVMLAIRLHVVCLRRAARPLAERAGGRGAHRVQPVRGHADRGPARAPPGGGGSGSEVRRWLAPVVAGGRLRCRLGPCGYACVSEQATRTPTQTSKMRIAR